MLLLGKHTTCGYGNKAGELVSIFHPIFEAIIEGLMCINF
jgi:hypothetical protein